MSQQGTFNWRASSYPDFIQNYFLLKRIIDLFDNRDKCRKPAFLRDNIYTSCASTVLLDHFANKSNTFQHSLSFPLCLSPPLALPFPSISSLGLHFLLSRMPGYRFQRYPVMSQISKFEVVTKMVDLFKNSLIK